jgi:hypothetical protein
MNVCRQPQATFDRFGDPVGYAGWLDAQGRIPFDFRLRDGITMPPFRLPCEGGPAASEQVRAVVAKGLRPPYDLGEPFEPDGARPERADCLLSWMPHDDAHLVRYTKQPKALVWLSNDSMAKDDLLLAARARPARAQSTPAEGSLPRRARFRTSRRSPARTPARDSALGREDAWEIDAMCAAYPSRIPSGGSATRPGSRGWRAPDRRAMPTGIVQRTVDDQLFGHTPTRGRRPSRARSSSTRCGA